MTALPAIDIAPLLAMDDAAAVAAPPPRSVRRVPTMVFSTPRAMA
jgi:hypothetical protein